MTASGSRTTRFGRPQGSRVRLPLTWAAGPPRCRPRPRPRVPPPAGRRRLALQPRGAEPALGTEVSASGGPGTPPLGQTLPGWTPHWSGTLSQAGSFPALADCPTAQGALWPRALGRPGHSAGGQSHRPPRSAATPAGDPDVGALVVLGRKFPEQLPGSEGPPVLGRSPFPPVSSPAVEGRLQVRVASVLLAAGRQAASPLAAGNPALRARDGGCGSGPARALVLRLRVFNRATREDPEVKAREADTQGLTWTSAPPRQRRGSVF